MRNGPPPAHVERGEVVLSEGHRGECGVRNAECGMVNRPPARLVFIPRSAFRTPNSAFRTQMSSRQLKAGSFVLTWLNIYAVSYYFNYLFFHLRDDFGFGNRENLLFAALNGLIYIPASWFGGKFAQRHGCHASS